MGNLYRAIPTDEETPVGYVGCHPLRWHRIAKGAPDIMFVPAEDIEKENERLRRACQKAYDIMCVIHPHDGGCGWDTDNPLPNLLRAALGEGEKE